MTATAKTLTLPDILREHDRQIVQALAHPLPMGWNDEVTYIGAEQAKAIGTVLVDAIHQGIQRASIGYLFRKDIKRRGAVTLAQASRVSGKLAYYSEHDFMNWDAWRFLSSEQRVALIDHELTHFAETEDEKGNRSWILVPHDVEEFGSIVRRWGLWKPDLKRFAQSFRNIDQRELFGDAVAGSGDEAEA